MSDLTQEGQLPFQQVFQSGHDWRKHESKKEDEEDVGAAPFLLPKFHGQGEGDHY